MKLYYVKGTQRSDPRITSTAFVVASDMEDAARHFWLDKRRICSDRQIAEHAKELAVEVVSTSQDISVPGVVLFDHSRSQIIMFQEEWLTTKETTASCLR